MSNILSPGELVQVRLWCADSEQASVNTFHYIMGARTGVGPTDDDMANQLDGIFIANLVPMLYNGAQYRGNTVQIQQVTPQPLAAVSGSGPHSGTGGAIGLPRQVAAVGSWRTPYSGPKYRGRTYWPFPPAAADDGLGKPTIGYIADAANLMSALLAFSIVTGGGFAIACSLVIHSKLPAPAGTNTNINNFLGLDKWGTMKKRGSFGKANSSPI